MDPSDAKSIAESLIQRHAKDFGVLSILDSVDRMSLGFQEETALVDEVIDLVENAKITIEF